MAIDSHMHVNSQIIYNIDDAINKINVNANVESVINVGLNIKTSRECIEISKKENKFYSSIGIHPLYIKNENYNDLYKMIDDKVVAIGEMGLDLTGDNYYLQKEYLIKQIHIANELKLPVIIHSNNSNYEIIDVFEHFVKPKYGCVFHCFQPNIDVLKYIIDNGFFVSFAGKITYKNAKKSIEIIQKVPNNNFLIETDSPYLSPEPLRNQINESSNIKYIIKRISEIKGISEEDIEKITTNNIKTLFKKMR